VPLTFRALDVGPRVTPSLTESFAAAWPSYRAWFLREPIDARPSYAEARGAVAWHLPELLGTYDALCAAVGGGELEARFLSHWCPPPVATACSLATWTRDAHLLVRSYDYPPLLCDTTVLASSWTATRVLAMADCLWGAVDGINEHGLAVAIAFGGRPVVGPGFGIGLVVRYLLEVAHDVGEAIAILSRLPVSMSYNVALTDSRGLGAIVEVAPDRAALVTGRTTAANRQAHGREEAVTEWPEHARRSGTIERELALAAVANDPTATAYDLVGRFLAAPVHRDPALHEWGTVWTSVYDCDARTLDLHWPGETWHLDIGDVSGTRIRRDPGALVAA
jgi:predicted choloylglycine hydrolase